MMQFDVKSVKNLSLVFNTAHVVMIPGDIISVETRGIEEKCLFSELSSDGTLTISNEKRLNVNFWNHNRNSKFVPKILVTIPKNATFEKLKINIEEGNFVAKETELNCVKGFIGCGAANLSAGSINGDKVNFHCGMGNLTAKGSIKISSNIDCGLGCVTLNLSGDQNNYSYDAKVALGDFSLNDIKKGGVGKINSEENKENNFSVRCALGKVAIKLEK